MTVLPNPIPTGFPEFRKDLTLPCSFRNWTVLGRQDAILAFQESRWNRHTTLFLDFSRLGTCTTTRLGSVSFVDAKTRSLDNAINCYSRVDRFRGHGIIEPFIVGSINMLRVHARKEKKDQ